MSVLFYAPGNGNRVYVDSSLGATTTSTLGTGTPETKAAYPRLYNAFASNAYNYQFTNQLPLSLTIEFWFRSTSDSTSARCLLMPSQGSDSKKLQTQYSETSGKIDTITFENRNNTSNLTLSLSSLNLNARDWHHISYVQDADNDIIYAFVDGVQRGSTTMNSNDYRWNIISLASKSSSMSSAAEYGLCDLSEVLIVEGAKREQNVDFVPSLKYAVNTGGMLSVGTESTLNILTPGGINTSVDALSQQMVSKADRDLVNANVQNTAGVTLLFGGGSNWTQGQDIVLSDDWTNYDLINFTYSEAGQNVHGTASSSFVDSKSYPVLFLLDCLNLVGSLALFGYTSRFIHLGVRDTKTFNFIRNGDAGTIGVIGVYGIKLNPGIKVGV